MNGLGIIQVLLPAASALMASHTFQRQVHIQTQRVKGCGVKLIRLLCDIVQRNAAHPADRSGKVFIYYLLVNSDGLENLGALVGLNRGNAHLGGNLYDSMENRAVVIIHCRVIILVKQMGSHQLPDSLLGQIGIDGAGAVAEQGRELVHLSGLAALQNQGHAGPLLGGNQMLVQARHSQQGGNRHMVLIHAPVRDNQDIDALPVRPVRIHVQAVHSLFQARVLIIGNRKHLDLEARHFHIFNFQNVRIRQNRMIDAQETAVLRLLLQHISILAHIDRRGGHNLLTDRVDGRVRYLGEALLEIIEQRLMLVGQGRDGRIDTHGGDALAAVLRHIQNGIAVFLIVVPEGFLKPSSLVRCKLRHPLVGDLQIFELHQVAVQPLAVGLSGSVSFLQRLVVHDLAFYRIHQKHFSGMQALFHENLRGIDIQHAHLRGQDQGIVCGDVITGRPKTVAVQNGSHHISVAEQNGGRAVPGLHHGGVILVEIPFLLRHGSVIVPGLRNRNHHGQRQVHAAHHQEFQCVVQHGRVGTGGVHHRKHLVQVLFQIRRLHGLLPGQHLIRISLNRVDLAIVHDETVRVGPLPAWVRVGAETGMYDGDSRLVILILQIRKEGSELVHQEHALVYNRPAGKGYHIGIIIGLLEDTAGHIELPVKIQSLFHIRRPFYKALHDTRHLLQSLASQHRRNGGHLSPAQELHAFLFHNDLEHLAGLIPLQLVLGEEKHTDSVISFST